MTTDNLRQFVRRHSNVYLALKGCLQQFDTLAGDFTAAADSDSELLGDKIAQAEAEAAKLEKEAVSRNAKITIHFHAACFFQDKQSAKIYIQFMKKMQEKGVNFANTERTRLQSLLNGKISDNKKAELNQKLNILSAYNYDAKTESRSEL